MGKYEQRTPYRIVMILGVLVIAAAVGVAIFEFGGKESGKSDVPPKAPTVQENMEMVDTDVHSDELVVRSIEEQEGAMAVVTSYCTLRYPYAFSDLIQVEAVNDKDQSRLEFAAVINGVKAALFTICFNVEEAIALGELDHAGERMAVSAVIHEADPALDENDVNTFFAAQEIFNDIVVSLQKNENFIATN